MLLGSSGLILARRRTRFGILEIVERDGLRLLVEDGQVHSGLDLDDPERLAFPYLEILAAGVTACAGPPGRALVIGVGGGSFSSWLARSGWDVTGVDVNRRAVALGRRYLNLDPRVDVVIDDGRRYLDRRDGPWDLVVLDASSEDYVPPQLATAECFARVAAQLAPGGLALMTSWRSAPRADDELARWASAFAGAFELYRPGTGYENRVLLGRHDRADPTPAIHTVDPRIEVTRS